MSGLPTTSTPADTILAWICLASRDPEWFTARSHLARTHGPCRFCGVSINDLTGWLREPGRVMFTTDDAFTPEPKRRSRP
jgi:hypothetical protein